MDADVLLETRGLTKRFGQNTAVADFGLSLHKGEIVGLLGPNGAGKTTTLRMLAGCLAPSQGDVRICGVDLAEQPKAAKRAIGYLPERPPVYGELSVDEYLRYCAALRGLRSQARREALNRAKQACGLTDAGDKLIGTLSTGYQQRVGLAQAIVHSPRVVILDEPTVGLDPIQIREIRGLIRGLGEAHGIILSSHILPEVQAVCDRVMIIHRGRVVYSDTMAATTQAQFEAVLITLTRSPAVTALQQIAGVRGIEELGGGQWRLRLADGADPRQALAQAAVAGDWGLIELKAEIKTLEERFVELTSSDEPALRQAA
ncbi:MAG: ATP-binding cassette domain-containing protein [Gammaproteobacteria bacterium]|nr:ATP-binding cassette domain-containing protein [Gammaproteobacteria bacterium]